MYLKDKMDETRTSSKI